MSDQEKIPDPVQAIADAAGGRVEWRADLPDGSGAATVSFPLPKNHWLYRSHANVPPMPFRMGSGEYFLFAVNPKLPPEGGQDRGLLQAIDRDAFARAIRAAGKYALRCSTMNGTADQDPDALLQNLIVGMLGYWTETGLGSDEENSVLPYSFEAPQ